MNDFAVNLVGLHGIFKKARYYKAGAQEKTRTFICMGGPGCDPDPARGRKITGKWLADNMPDTISSYDLESVIDDKGRYLYPVEVKFTEVDVCPEPDDVPKKKRG